MSQPQINNPQSSSDSGKPDRALPKHTAIILIILTIFSLLVVGYNTLSPHMTTLTQQQFVTNTQILGSTSTVMDLRTQTVTSTTSIANTNLPAGYYQYCNVYNCNPYAAPPGYYNFGCTSSGPYGVINSYPVQCSGYLYMDSSGCTDLLVPVDNGYANNIQQYYHLRNLPASHPSIGSWVTVTGQLIMQDSSTGLNGGTCPATSILVSSIS